MPSISLFEIIEVVFPEPCIFFWTLASIAEAAVIIPNGAKTFFANRTATFINAPVNLLNKEPNNNPGSIILDI